MSVVKCRNCKGTGLVPTEHGPKRWEKCPICKGRGTKQSNDNIVKQKDHKGTGGMYREHGSKK